MIVTAGNASSDQETTPNLGFILLPTAEAERVGAQEQKIRALGLSDAATRFLIANLFEGYGLYAEAIEQFCA